MIRVEKWKRKREYAIYEDDVLLAVTAYKKGALALQARLDELTARVAQLERDLHAALGRRSVQFALPLGA